MSPSSPIDTLKPSPPPPPVRPTPKRHVHHLHDDKLQDILLDHGPGLLLTIPGQGVPPEDPDPRDERDDDAARGEDARAAGGHGKEQHGLCDGEGPVVPRLPEAQDDGVAGCRCSSSSAARHVLARVGDGDGQRERDGLRGDVPVEDGGAAEEHGREDAVGEAGPVEVGDPVGLCEPRDRGEAARGGGEEEDGQDHRGDAAEEEVC